MTDWQDDSEIVRGLRAGDRCAWDALCAKYGDRVCRYVARLIGGDQEAVRDVFQETMLAVARSGRAIRPDTRLWAWLSAIGHNQAALHWRQVYRNRTGIVDDDPVDDQDTSDPTKHLDQAETRDSIRAILAEMDAGHVMLLTAKYIDEMPIKEIALAVGGTDESVRSKLARARRDFRQRYQRHLAQSEVQEPTKPDDQETARSASTKVSPTKREE